MLITHVAPKAILIAWLMVGLGVALAKHGQPQAKYNAWISLFVIAAELALLWWSGWFSS